MTDKRLQGAPRPLTWTGVAVAFAFGLLMLYMADQFQSPMYRFVTPYLLYLGSLFGVAAILMAASTLEVGLPAWFGPAGKFFFAAAFGWSTLSVLVYSKMAPGMIFNSAFILAILVSIWRPQNEALALRILLVIRLLATPVGNMIQPPGAFSAGSETWAQAIEVGASVLQLIGFLRPRSLWYRSGLAFGAVPLAWVAFSDLRLGNWTGASVFGVFTAASLFWLAYELHPWQWRIQGLRGRILALAIGLAVVPTLIVGASSVSAVRRLDRQEAFASLSSELHAMESQVNNQIKPEERFKPDRYTELMRSSGELRQGDVAEALPLSQIPGSWAEKGAVGVLAEPDGKGGIRLTAFEQHPDLGLALAVHRGHGDAYDQAEKTAKGILGGVLLVTLIGIGLAIPLSDMLTRRLSQVRVVLDEVGKQHFEVRLPDWAVDDELSGLALTVNEMAAALETSHEQLRVQADQLSGQNQELQSRRIELFEQNAVLVAQREELNARVKQQQAVAHFSQFALSASDFERLIGETVRVVADVLPVTHVGIWALSPDGAMCDRIGGSGWQEQRYSVPVPPSAGPEGISLATGPLVVSDLRVHPRFKDSELVRANGLVSLAAVQIPVLALAQGVIIVYSTRPQTYTDDHLYFLRAVANIVATAADHFHAEQLSTLQHAVAATMSEVTGFDEAAERVLEDTCNTLHWDVGVLWMVDPLNEVLRCARMWVNPEISIPLFESLTPRATFSMGSGILGRVWASKEATWSVDVGADQRYDVPALAGREGLHGALFFPVLLDGDVFGVMEFFARESRREDPGMLRLMSGIGNQIGQFLQRKRSEEERDRLLVLEHEERIAAETAADQIRRLQKVTDAALAGLAVSELLPEMLNRVCEALEVQFAAVSSSLEDGAVRIRAHVGLPNGVNYVGTVIGPGEGFASERTNGEMRVYDEAPAWRFFAPELRSQVKSAAIAPMCVEGRQTGVLVVAAFEPAHFTEYHRQVLQLVADRMALAIDRAELFDAEVKARQDVEAKSVEIRQMNAELEERVIQRTAQLESAVKELEAFGYSVSHDLRSPLRTMDGFSQLLLEDYGGLFDEQGKDYLVRIRSSSQRMGQMIDALLQLSRVTRGEMQHDLVDLTQIARTIFAELERQNPERRVKLVVEEGLTAQCDGRLVRIVLENLLGNSWKFTSKQSDPVIQFGQTQIDGLHVFFIRDNGVGFKMAHAEKLFMPFQRLHTSEQFPGTGIGLATVRRIIVRHGGRIWAEAAVGEGATFYFTL